VEPRLAKLAERIRDAAARSRPLRIRGSGSKDFYGNALAGETLDAAALTGIVDYEPTELVITALAGTPLTEIEAALAARGQMLAFEPPHFGATATVGGCVAAGLSGPRRASVGAVRDFVLGVRILDGRGDHLRFGGTVIKNVAGYDVSRVMTGSLGTLGVITEVSLKVLPVPVAEITLRLQKTAAEAITLMNEWGGRPLPVSATCHAGNQLNVRLSGAAAAVRAARAKIGGEELPDAAAFWAAVREQTLPFFAGAQTLWRFSVKSTVAPLALPGSQLIEWGGALRWLAGDGDAKLMREAAEFAGGHATLFRAPDKSAGTFHPLSPALAALHRRLKASFDPAGIFNPGRMYPEL
jgi:glycolate oxidase FAD binding subunit